MELLLRIAQVIVPVFLIVAIGFGYGRRRQPDLRAFNRMHEARRQRLDLDE